MNHLVMTQPRIPRVDDYEPLIGAESVERIRSKAEKFKVLRVANFNSTYYGGGVAETLSSLMNSLGLQAEWRVIQGTPDFFSITKKMHNALQGGEIVPPTARFRVLDGLPRPRGRAHAKGLVLWLDAKSAKMNMTRHLKSSWAGRAMSSTVSNARSRRWLRRARIANAA